MSSESGRKSPRELKAQAKMNLAQAAQTETYVSITEKNWRALIQSQQTQIDILSTMMSTMETLATWNDLSDMQQEQLDKLTSHAEETQQTLTEFQDTLQQQAEQIQMATSTSLENFQSQAGKANEENHLGSDSAYLAAEVINIIDNDTHIEDCTTMKKPRHEHKNTLGGM